MDHQLLNKLSEEARQKREILSKIASDYKELSKAERHKVAMAKEESKRATCAHVEAYKALGLNRQTEWQREKISKGLCKLCGNPSDKFLCPACSKKASGWARKGHGLVEQ